MGQVASQLLTRIQAENPAFDQGVAAVFAEYDRDAAGVLQKEEVLGLMKDLVPVLQVPPSPFLHPSLPPTHPPMQVCP